MIDYNYEAGTVIFATTHFSKFVRISLAESKLQKVLLGGFDTGFEPDEYGWFIKNWGSFETYGNCLGMSAVTKFYFNYKDKIKGQNLYDRYIEGIEEEEFDDTIAQELAGRADVILEPRFYAVREALARLGYNYDGIKNLYPKLILQNIVLTGLSELLYIRKTKILGSSTAATIFECGVNHVLLVYECADGKMYLYDPNYPARR